MAASAVSLNSALIGAAAGLMMLKKLMHIADYDLWFFNKFIIVIIARIWVGDPSIRIIIQVPQDKLRQAAAKLATIHQQKVLGGLP